MVSEYPLKWNAEFINTLQYEGYTDTLVKPQVSC